MTIVVLMTGMIVVLVEVMQRREMVVIIHQERFWGQKGRTGDVGTEGRREGREDLRGAGG